MDSNDNLSLFKHQNQILHPKKWYKTCVTLIYYNLKEMSCHEKSKMAAILDLGMDTYSCLVSGIIYRLSEERPSCFVSYEYVNVVHWDLPKRMKDLE